MMQAQSTNLTVSNWSFYQTTAETSLTMIYMLHIYLIYISIFHNKTYTSKYWQARGKHIRHFSLI